MLHVPVVGALLHQVENFLAEGSVGDGPGGRRLGHVGGGGFAVGCSGVAAVGKRVPFRRSPF